MSDPAIEGIARARIGGDHRLCGKRAVWHGLCLGAFGLLLAFMT